MMKKRIPVLFSLCLMALALHVPASASGLEYNIAEPEQSLFGAPTTDDTIYVTYDEPANIDVSKNAALIPPGFGSPTSNLPNSGTPLTPNLVQDNPAIISGGAVTGGSITTTPPSVTTGGGSTVTQITNSFTDVTSDLYYNAGHIGKLRISAIGLTVNVYEGTGSSVLAKGAGHFSETSVWGGNVAIAGHNRGVNNHFGKIHTLEYGDIITYTTKLGTQEYEVYSVEKISATDTSVLRSSNRDTLTLITCVSNQSDYRWCVVARAIS